MAPSVVRLRYTAVARGGGGGGGVSPKIYWEILNKNNRFTAFSKSLNQSHKKFMVVR